jgi:FkbM family methyltransferase
MTRADTNTKSRKTLSSSVASSASSASSLRARGAASSFFPEYRSYAPCPTTAQYDAWCAEVSTSSRHPYDPCEQTIWYVSSDGLALSLGVGTRVIAALKRAKNKAAARYPGPTGGLVTVVGRAVSRKQRKLRVYYDGQDWIHTWRYGVLVSDVPSTFPHRATHENLPLFFARFKPSEGQTILDVGAGVGTEVLEFSKLVGKKGRVICVEADPDACRQFSKAVRLADLTNVVLINRAVTDHEGEVFLSQGATSVSNSVMVESEVGVVVQSTTLDQLLDEIRADKVDYLKMNIEGAEVLALQGFTTGHSRVRNWCISCHDFKRRPESKTFDRVSNWLNLQGLTVWQHERNDARPWESYYLYARADEPGAETAGVFGT